MATTIYMSTVDSDIDGADAADNGLVPSSAGLLFPSVLCLHLGLFLADLGTVGPARLADSAGRFRAGRFRLPRAGSYSGKPGVLRLLRSMCTGESACNVPGGPARPSGSEFFGFSGRTRGLADFVAPGFAFHGSTGVKWPSPSPLVLLRCGKKLDGVVSRNPAYSGYTVL